MPSKKNKKNDDSDTIGFGDPADRPRGPLADDEEVAKPPEEEEEVEESNTSSDDDEDDDDTDDEEMEGHGYHTVDFDSDEGESF